MIFNSWPFLAFFVVVYAAYRVLGVRGQNRLLLIASYAFYAQWDWRFTGLLAFSTVVDFFVARAMPGATDRARRWLMGASLTSNLGILGFFKYFDFFIDSAAALLTRMGFEAHLPTLGLILPVGISFYTFQTLAYTIDVYRGRLAPCERPTVFALYVSFFPQLVAGPIERAQSLLPQFEKARTVSSFNVSSGALLILIGFVRKVLIADVLAAEVNRCFASPDTHSSAALLAGAIAFGLQIYGDFAGYSDMARGLGRMLGIELMENFNHPYFAKNITIFWRRWHISLSTWLRDYLYIPLGGNRRGEARTYLNLMATMLLGGLWHGASWNFVIWGGLHGVALAAHKLVSRGPVRRKSSLPISLLSWATTMLLVTLAWVFFRADGIDDALAYVRALASFRGDWALPPWKPLLWCGALLLFIDVPQARSGDHTVMLRWPWWVRGPVYFVLLMLIILYAPAEESPFIYFQF